MPTSATKTTTFLIRQCNLNNFSCNEQAGENIYMVHFTNHIN